MSDAFYRFIRFFGSHPFWMSSRYVVTGLEHIPTSGPAIIACTHSSPFDVPLLIRHSPRLLDFVSIVEVFENPFVAWFYGSMNAFPLDRHKPDAPTVRTIFSRLEQARAVALFPEGAIRRGERSVIRTRTIKPGVGRIANRAGAPVIPAVVVNSIAYARLAGWSPTRSTRYAVAFGPPIAPTLDSVEIERSLVAELVRLFDAASASLPESCRVI